MELDCDGDGVQTTEVYVIDDTAPEVSEGCDKGPMDCNGAVMVLIRGRARCTHPGTRMCCPLKPSFPLRNAVILSHTKYDGSFESIVHLPLRSKRIIGFVDR